jgi:hypothetical protein
MYETQEKDAVVFSKPNQKEFIKNTKELQSVGKGSHLLTLTSFSQEGEPIGDPLTFSPTTFWQTVGSSSTEITVAGAICLAVDSGDPQAVADIVTYNENVERHTRKKVNTKNRLAKQLVQDELLTASIFLYWFD